MASHELELPQLSAGELERMRAWRTWLLIVTNGGQGLQWAFAPSWALDSRAFHRVNPTLGAAGWRVIGAALVVVALLLIARRTRMAGHVLGAFVYLALMFALALALYWPALTILAAGLHYGEVWVAAAVRRRRRRQVLA